jgi:hypothetical protein
MDVIRDFADWLTTGWGDRLGVLFPLAVTGLLGLYLLWLLIGYLRVSQVGVRERHPAQPVVALPPSPDRDGLPAAPRGVPYCAADGLQYPIGARFCASCERDLVLECVTCGATLAAGDASCYRCGTRTGAGDHS